MRSRKGRETSVGRDQVQLHTTARITGRGSQAKVMTPKKGQGRICRLEFVRVGMELTHSLLVIIYAKIHWATT